MTAATIQPQQWQDILASQHPHGTRRYKGAPTILAVLMIVIGSIILSLPITLTLAMTPPPTPHSYEDTGLNETQLEQAAAYDQQLLESPPIALGEATDPFTPGAVSPAYETDRDYQNQLGSGSRMAAIRIPKIGVNLNIGHGTSEGTLYTGAGHIYGTTLPVGDEGNTVIAAHRGLGARLLFYRVGELEKGDLVYTTAAGRQVAWKIDRIQRLEPGSQAERDAVTPRKGETRLTLYTCDPPGLNTMRLLIGAHRVPYIDPATAGGQTDPMIPWIVAAAVAIPSLTITLLATPKHAISRHASRRISRTL